MLAHHLTQSIIVMLSQGGARTKFDRFVDPNVPGSTNLLQLSSFIDLKYTEYVQVLLDLI